MWLEPTPGHTPGHVSVHIRSRGEEAVITGDMMHHPIQLAAPEMHGNFDMDKEQGAKTRRAFVERYADRKVHDHRHALLRSDLRLDRARRRRVEARARVR